MKLIILFLSLSLLFAASSCVTAPEVVYRDVPATHTVIKRDTLDKLINETIRTKMELLECLDKIK